MTNKRDSSASTRKPRAQPREAPRNGLLDLQADRPRQLYWGTLALRHDRLLLRQAYDKDVSILCFAGENAHELDQHVVSVVGHVAGTEGSDQPVVAEKVVSHEAVARRAYELHESGSGGSALDNWLRAERELLGY